MVIPTVWRTLATSVAYDNPWYTVRRDDVQLPNGHVTDFYVSVRPHVAITLPVTPTGEAVLVRQYKHGAGAVTLELPAGTFTAPEQADAAAARELLEETGYSCASLQPVGDWWDDATKNTHRVMAFLGHDAQAGGLLDLDATEEIESVLVPAADLGRLITDGTIRAMSSVAVIGRCLPLLT